MAEGIADEAVAVVLAGGQGTRLGGLTLKRCKPALPFGAHCRSIDFTLSNCLHSGLAHVGVAAQYKADSLVPHLERHWRQGNPFEGRPVEIWEADARRGGPYAGTADAVYKNLRAIERLKAKFVLVLAADHVYRMDYAELLDFHRRQGADLTVACHPVVPEEAHHFGIMSVADDEIVAFHEKPVDVDVGPAPLASMGVYVFDAELLAALLREDARRPGSRHDFGRDVVPACVAAPGVRVAAFPHRDPCADAGGYWCDIGTIDAYWEASMALLGADAALDPGDPRWPILPTLNAAAAGGPGCSDGVARIAGCLAAEDCRIEGATVRRSLLFGGVRIEPGAVVEDSVLLPGAHVGPDCRVHRAIIDEGVVLGARSRVHGAAGIEADGCETSAGGVALVCSSLQSVPGRSRDERARFEATRPLPA